MGLFRRRTARAVDPRPAIADFWSWWAANRGDVVKAVEEDRSDDALRMLQPLVAALDERLSWQIGGSGSKRFALVLSSAGEPELRGVAERWMMAAPDDPEVEFLSTRKRDPSVFGSTLKVDDYDFDMSELEVGARVDTSSGKVDVVVHHPLFTLVDHDHRLHVGFVGLDAALGETDVERWIGSVDVAVDRPIDAIPMASLSDVVDQLSSAGSGEWAAMEGRGPRGPVFAIIRRSVGRHSHPLADTHVAVVLGYDAAGNGMPADPTISTDIEELEGQIVDAWGGEGPRIVHVGHVTGGGQVVAHFYVDGLEIDAEAIRPVLGGWSRGKTSIATSHDPRWEHVAAFMR
ncbi:hypothetical protein [Phytoactinopolyspora halotolerans]|uniref:DUF695 domain-containing protein n=1 Tax=Phytoactinopolyspora halotolerans TaxID=1981512 RepID=A0A6L9S2E3_9ACTN|nr:hypothetical protein [Phytoactinopolyspora halotolerans]NED99206.1 hypothetical protein [Phytoactinopolyspora halotolerans]